MPLKILLRRTVENKTNGCKNMSLICLCLLTTCSFEKQKEKTARYYIENQFLYQIF